MKNESTLLQQAKVGQKCKKGTEEVYHRPGWGPRFGCFDLLIVDNCNQNRESWAYLGRTYETINGLQQLDQGHSEFLVSEIEVFLVE